MENQNKKSQEQAGPFTGDESKQNPPDASTLGHSTDKIVIKDGDKTKVVDVEGVVQTPLTEKIRKPVEEVTTIVSTDANTIVDEKVKETVPETSTTPDDDGNHKPGTPNKGDKADHKEKEAPKKTTHK